MIEIYSLMNVKCMCVNRVRVRCDQMIQTMQNAEARNALCRMSECHFYIGAPKIQVRVFNFSLPVAA